MMNAIVTGANGFIGRAVCSELASNGVNVIAVVRNKLGFEKNDNEKIQIIEADLNEYRDLETCLPQNLDVFYHFAWDGAYGEELANYSKQIRNIEYNCDAIMMAQRIGCKKFIMAGTINELELFQFFQAERNVPRKSCIYGIAKLACDFMGKTIAAEGKMDFNVAIIGSCFGPGDKSNRIHNTVIRSLMNGEAPTLISGDTLHDWVYIDDVAKMFRYLGEKSSNMKSYYLGHRKLRRLEDIIRDVRDVVNPDIQLKFGEIKSSFKIDYSLVDINALYEETGFEAQADFKESIKKTQEWLRKRND